MAKIVLFHKPFNVLCQFTDEQGRVTLKDYINIPKVYPAGRLDRDSEGLLVLTDNGIAQSQISHRESHTSKTYWAQVEGIPTDEAISQLCKGVELKDGKTRPAKCERMDEPNPLENRDPPIRVRKNIPDSWISLTITEGRNRQVRRMCAAVGFPVLRLIRYRVGDWTIDDIPLGTFKEIDTVL